MALKSPRGRLYRASSAKEQRRKFRILRDGAMALSVGFKTLRLSIAHGALERLRTDGEMHSVLSTSVISPGTALRSLEIRTPTASTSRCFNSAMPSFQIFFSTVGAGHRPQSVGLRVTGFTRREGIDFQHGDRRKYWLRAASEEEIYLPDLQVPKAWVAPDIAAQEADWLKRALHKWLDDEFCPEAANEEISTRCAKVYYYCLLEEQLDVGDILMQMVRDLETFSFKESFHGAFSSANAAIDLITKRMRNRATNSN